ncbi:hypothetical protein [Streptomyces sp. NPDC058653]
MLKAPRIAHRIVSPDRADGLTDGAVEGGELIVRMEIRDHP